MTPTVTGRHVDVVAATCARILRKLGPITRILNDQLVSILCVIRRGSTGSEA